jgi:hypothetical protein
LYRDRQNNTAKIPLAKGESSSHEIESVERFHHDLRSEKSPFPVGVRRRFLEERGDPRFAELLIAFRYPAIQIDQWSSFLSRDSFRKNLTSDLVPGPDQLRYRRTDDRYSPRPSCLLNHLAEIPTIRVNDLR